MAYNIKLTNGTALSTILPLENLGEGSLSVPRQIIDINFDSTSPHFTIADDVTSRFTTGFKFNIVGGSAYDGTYTVSSSPTTEILADGKVVTHIPVATPPTNSGFDIVGVESGTTGKWLISGPINGDVQFYAGSTFTVSGNATVDANGSYTVTTATTGRTFTVKSITPGTTGIGNFTFAGDVVNYFVVGAQFTVANSKFDQAFTVASKSVNGTGDTEITVVETIQDPVITTTGSQSILFTSLSSGALSTGLVNATTYTATITVDGVDYPISVLGSSAQTFNDLVTQLQTDLGSAATVKLDTTHSRIVITSNTTGLTSTVQVTVAGTLFAPQLSLFYGFNVPIAGYQIDPTNVLVTLLSPITVITTGNIPVGTEAGGKAHPTAPAYFSFIPSGGTAQIGITPVTTHNYLVTLRISGDHASKFVPNTPFTLYKAIYNGKTYTNNWEVDDATPSVYVTAGDYTEIVVKLVDPLDAFPAITADVNTKVIFPLPAVPYGHMQYTLGTSTTSLQLVGPGCPVYNADTTWGHALQRNTIKLLENFSNNVPPVAPLDGQIWFDNSVPALNVFQSSNKYNVTAVTAGLNGTLTIAGDHTAEFSANTKFYFYDNVSVGETSVLYTVSSVALSTGDTVITVVETLPTMTINNGEIYGKIYVKSAWNSVVSTSWPTQSFIDMNDFKVVRVADATTTFPYVTSTTGLGQNAQEVVNLRTADALYIAKTGGSSAITTDRSGTMTGSLNMNGASPVGASTIGINMNSAPITMYGTSDLVFDATGSGSITLTGTGNITVGSGTDKVVVQNNVGSYPTVVFSTTTSSSPVLNLGANRIVNVSDPTAATDVANKQYVDSLVNGIVWILPVKDPNLFDDSLSAPPVIDSTITFHKTYLVNAPATGDWTGLDNRVVTYDGTQWVDILGREVQVGDRFGVFCEPNSDDPLSGLPAGGLLDKAGKIVTVATIAPYTYTDYTPAEPDAFSVTGGSATNKSLHFGHSYTFRGTWGTGTFGTNYKWIEFSGPQLLVDGAGLKYTGNILNVGAGFGITANTDTIQINQTDLDTVYVQKAGIETITGEKTFSAATTVNNTFTVAPNGTDTDMSVTSSTFSVAGQPVSVDPAYTISLTAGNHTAGGGGSITLTSGVGSTIGGNISITTGAGASSDTSGSIVLTAGLATLTLDPQGAWKVDNIGPSGVNQAIVSNSTSPTTGAPSWSPIAHMVAAAPASSADAGNIGDWFADDTHFYVYGATGWRRIATSTF